MTEYRIRLEEIIDAIDAATGLGAERVSLDLDDARWLVETIDRLEKEREDLRQQVNQLADAALLAAGIAEGE